MLSKLSGLGLLQMFDELYMSVTYKARSSAGELGFD
jgi:hypothetical protein